MLCTMHARISIRSDDFDGQVIFFEFDMIF